MSSPPTASSATTYSGWGPFSTLTSKHSVRCLLVAASPHVETYMRALVQLQLPPAARGGEALKESFLVPYQGAHYWVHYSTGEARCYLYQATGHVRRDCPLAWHGGVPRTPDPWQGASSSSFSSHHCSHSGLGVPPPVCLDERESPASAACTLCGRVPPRVPKLSSLPPDPTPVDQSIGDAIEGWTRVQGKRGKQKARAPLVPPDAEAPHKTRNGATDTKPSTLPMGSVHLPVPVREDMAAPEGTTIPPMQSLPAEALDEAPSVPLPTVSPAKPEVSVTSGTSGEDPGVVGVIQERTEQLCSQWRCLRGQAEERERWLRGLLVLAERFWQGLTELALSLTDTQQMVLDLEEASSDPEAVRARLCTMQALREEIDVLQNDLDTLGILGVELMSSCGDPDKPDVTKSLDDLYSSWHSLSKVWTERQGRLQEQLQASLRYQKAMQGLCDWLATAELRMAEEFLVGGDLELVRHQLAELKEFKRELYQCKVDVESLRHHAGAEDRGPPALLSDFRQRWDCLEEEIVSRQHQLEAALLGLGQFQNQLEELLQWISHTAEQLQGQTPLSLDLQSCEIELAKHKVLRNDVMSHARTVQSVNEVGQGLLLSSLGDSTDSLQCSLQQLNQRWDFVRSETENRQLELENNLSQVQDVTLEIMDLLQWLEHVELRLFFSKPVWDHPETTKEKLAAHLELAKELESKQQAYNSVRDRLQRLLASCSLPRACSTEHSLRILQQKWESVHSQVQERKERLAEGLTLSTEFHSTAQELLQWLGQMEESLSAPEQPSFLLETVLRQVQEHKVLLKEVTAHGEQLSSLEAVAARLKNVSRKQDCAVIQSLVLTAKERVAKVLRCTGERGAALEDARKRAKQFSESRQLLLDWMDEVEQTLEIPGDAAMSQEEIKCQLAEHKVWRHTQRAESSSRALLGAGRLPRRSPPPREAPPSTPGVPRQDYGQSHSAAAHSPRDLRWAVYGELMDAYGKGVQVHIESAALLSVFEAGSLYEQTRAAPAAADRLRCPRDSRAARPSDPVLRADQDPQSRPPGLRPRASGRLSSLGWSSRCRPREPAASCPATRAPVGIMAALLKRERLVNVRDCLRGPWWRGAGP
nr:microtubule-actin cross-linking factor 1-like [Chelonoidis abingdonii]